MKYHSRTDSSSSQLFGLKPPRYRFAQAHEDNDPPPKKVPSFVPEAVRPPNYQPVETRPTDGVTSSERRIRLRGEEVRDLSVTQGMCWNI